MAIQFDNTNTASVTLRPGTATGSLILGGDSINAAGSTNAVVVSGSGNTASGSSSAVVGGTNNTASSTSTVIVGGDSNTANQTYACIFGGQSNVSSNIYSTVISGTNNVANSVKAVVIGGDNGITRGVAGNFVYPSSNAPISGLSGRQQLATLLLGRETTDATATVLTSNSSAAGTTNQVILPNNSAYYFRGSITSGVTGGGNSAMWSFEGGIKRGANAASTTIIQSVINPVAADTGASSWIVALSADTTNGGLAVTVTGQASTTIRWVCKIETTEMTY